jgi:hypothetical protein
MKSKIILIFLLFFTATISYSQHENVSLDHPVYGFLKIMSVKKIIGTIHDDNPNLSRKEIAEYINTISVKRNELSSAEKEQLDKYKIEFIDDEESRKNTYSLFGGNIYPKYAFSENFTDKQKYLYAAQKDDNKLFINGLGHFYYIGEFQPSEINSALFDLGFRVRGSLFNHLGYYFSFIKGGATGSSTLAKIVDPRLKYNLKFNENLENLNNYDFPIGYLRYYAEPSDGMGISLQFGREQIKYGLGYSNSLTLSGLGPDMDFFKFGFKYGVINLSSIHASTVGQFSKDIYQRYTKFLALNRLSLSFKDVLDFGITDGEVYSGRGVEFGYLLPFGFYKFIEMSLQDRDNAIAGLDFQTHFLKNIEFQGSLFLDEDPINYLQDITLINNKTAYQLGTFIYEPFKISNLSFIFEYTKIRPYVYTHTNIQNTFTANGTLLGHQIGPNADQIYSKLSYNFSGKTSLGFEYQHIRKGKNVTDSLGNVIKNVGGDEYFAYRFGVDNDHPQFLDGIRINTDIFSLILKTELFRSIFVDLDFSYSRSKNLQTNVIDNLTYSYIRISVDY